MKTLRFAYKDVGEVVELRVLEQTCIYTRHPEGKPFGRRDSSYTFHADDGNSLVLSTCSEPEWVDLENSPFYLYLRGCTSCEDDKIVAVPKEKFTWYVVPAVLAYNDEFNKNIRTYEDVFIHEEELHGSDM